MYHHEFTNSTALTREAATSWRRMETHETEVPFIPQIFGGDPGDMATAAEMLAPSADVIDLNFGCPAPKVTNICAGAALMGEPDRLVNMVETIVDRVDIPVTAKMRLGTGRDANNSTEICERLEEVGAERLCIHGRTAATVFGGRRLDEHQGGRESSGSARYRQRRCCGRSLSGGLFRTHRCFRADDWQRSHWPTDRVLGHQGRVGLDESGRTALGKRKR